MIELLSSITIRLLRSMPIYHLAIHPLPLVCLWGVLPSTLGYPSAIFPPPPRLRPPRPVCPPVRFRPSYLPRAHRSSHSRLVTPPKRWLPYASFPPRGVGAGLGSSPETSGVRLLTMRWLSAHIAWRFSSLINCYPLWSLVRGGIRGDAQIPSDPGFSFGRPVALPVPRTWVRSRGTNGRASHTLRMLGFP